LEVANKEDLCEVGICVGWSGAPYADAELTSSIFVRIMTADDRR
jgi:hypothetical protein